MLERPALRDEEIAACLLDEYGVRIAHISFLPIGYDATASVFRLESEDGRPYFLKTKRVPVRPATLAVPHFLHQLGIDPIVAPLPSQSGDLSVPLGKSFTAILYPFVEGRGGGQGGLSLAQWRTLGDVMRRVHATVLPPGLAAQLPWEGFVPLKGTRAWRLHREIIPGRLADPVSQELAAFWQGRRAEIEAILHRAEELGRLAQDRAAPQVLCHADIHVFNVLVDPAENIHVVDWDETIVAPRERDLMFVVDGTVGVAAVAKAEEAAFMSGYGTIEVDPVLLAYYRYEWVVQEIAEFGEQVLTCEEGELTRRDGLRHFRNLFAPGNVVEGAYAADALLAG